MKTAEVFESIIALPEKERIALVARLARETNLLEEWRETALFDARRAEESVSLDAHFRDLRSPGLIRPVLALRFKRSAEKELLRLDEEQQKRIGAQLLGLRDNPFPAGCAKLKGREGYRRRSGMYRVLYVVDHANKEVVVFAVGHRREIYR